MLAPDPPAFTFPDIGFVREGMIRMTPAQAGAVLRMCQHPRQRRISSEHVRVLSEMMRLGQWQPKSQLDFGRLGRRVVLVNGHHRMNAQIAAGVDVLWSVAIHDCQAEEDLNRLYFRFDTNVRKRSRQAIAAGADLTSALGVRAQMAASALAATPVIAGGLSIDKSNSNYRTAASLAEVAMAVAKDYRDEIQAFERWVAPARKNFARKLRGATVMSVALVTARHQPEMAERFWSAVAADDGLRQGDPRKTFLRFLTEGALDQYKMNTPILVTARCWNAFFAGERLQLVRPSQLRPMPLLGTPFTAGGE